MGTDVVYWDKYHEHLDYGVEDFFTSCLKKKPSWFSSLKKQHINVQQHMNVKTCPSFIEVFKKSLLYKTPTDLVFSIRNKYVKLHTPDGLNDWFADTSHTQQGGYNQMGDEWNKDLYNIKLNPSIKFSSKKNIEFVFMDPIYYNYNNGIMVAPGTMKTNPKVVLQPNLNMFIDVSVDRDVLYKAGDVLSMVYFPNGIPVFKHKKIIDTPKRKFIGDYIYRTK
jgi:hypothetical protein